MYWRHLLVGEELASAAGRLCAQARLNRDSEASAFSAASPHH
uniref:Uncharacterized protein n=1 Tax=Arundo donax TaxID=35708 RepID=A0A0A9A5S9_ARUDO